MIYVPMTPQEFECKRNDEINSIEREVARKLDAFLLKRMRAALEEDISATAALIRISLQEVNDLKKRGFNVSWERLIDGNIIECWVQFDYEGKQ